MCVARHRALSPQGQGLQRSTAMFSALVWLWGEVGRGEFCSCSFLLCEFFSFSPLTALLSFLPLIVDKRERIEREREREIPESHSFPSLSSLSMTNKKKKKPTTNITDQPPVTRPISQDSSIYAPSEEFPEFQMSHIHRNHL